MSVFAFTNTPHENIETKNQDDYEVLLLLKVWHGEVLYKTRRVEKWRIQNLLCDVCQGEVMDEGVTWGGITEPVQG